MASEGGGAKSYLRAAFVNIYNLSLFGGAIVAAAATGEYVLAAAAIGVEAVWLLFGPDLRPFRRAVDKADREERDQADRARVDKLMESLPERDWQRAKALDELRRSERRPRTRRVRSGPCATRRRWPRFLSSRPAAPPPR